MDLSQKQKSHLITPSEAVARSFIRTFTGRNVFPLDMKESDIHINDIAHALSNQCRFVGHVNKFYSVAQHSVLVSNLLGLTSTDDELALAGLLHDAGEAYMVDLPTPIKRLMPQYEPAEEALQLVIETKYELQYALDDMEIHDADMVLLATEARDLMGNPSDWASLYGLTPLVAKIVPWEPEYAKQQFLSAFETLTRRRAN